MDLVTGINDHGRRLDRVLRKALPQCPLPLIHRLLRQGLILVNGRAARAHVRVIKGDKIRIPQLNTRKIVKKKKTENLRKIHEPKETETVLATQQEREKIINSAPAPRKKKIKPSKSLSLKFYSPPEVLFEGHGLVAFNKPAGLAVHGPASLEKMVAASIAGKVAPSLSFKSGPLHRLDKPSSGIVVFSKSLEGAKLFTRFLREQKINKVYLAVVEGEIEREQVWVDHLLRDREKKKTFVVNADLEESKIAVTKVMPLARVKLKEKPYTLVTAQIATGRTHQIRAQAASHGHPLAGDRKYGGRDWNGAGTDGAGTDEAGTESGGFFLHAWKMEFSFDEGDVKIAAPLPQGFDKLIKTVFGEDII